MTKTEKLISKLLNQNSLFTWTELQTLLKRAGYRELQGAGSRVRFDNGDPRAIIILHRPHPGNELKQYVRRLVIEKLVEGGVIGEHNDEI